ncbi:hypothetical protein CHU95_21835 [Niveispirillum lacus]|uniref:Uncharacterized protein n=1 Tax=Niveispirillum lacus TaxID=1981099 RepID=A0A255YRG0_9PROT|nr:hypothetical protein [Niveispirillum lacus]OYQ31771.1 hypothetical protein CHU95_21835 [Niveispirillum lacus]
MIPALGGSGLIWRIQAAPRDLARGVSACELSANCLVVPDATWTGLVPDAAYVECPTFFLEDKAGFVALLAFFVINSLRFRLYARAPAGEADGLLMAYPRLDDATMQMLRHFDPRSAQQINQLWQRLEAFLGRIALPGAEPQDLL